ncbi:MAG: hypothetical protein QOE22_597 [Candidatus Parcubacteria bacterium]|jgi:hypothetical protein|nr:hypothetical protein [Candidatus Parcubacteria bacterium]
MSLPARNAVIALVITLAIIGSVIYAINYLDRKRVAQLNDLQTRLATDTLSIETQFALLEETSCANLSEGNTLSREMTDLGDRLAFAETQLGNDNDQVIQLRKQYTLVQIRDYLLTKRLAEACDLDPTVALYFYSNETGACDDCDRASYALSYLHETNPDLRVYSFDYNLDLGALKTLIAVEKVEPRFPAFVIDGVRTYGFTEVDEFKLNFPKNFFATTSTSTFTTPLRR